MDFADFGKYLAQQRKLRGLSVQEVSAQTRISTSLIQALEHGARERLPGAVFIMNYVRAYSKVIGLSPDETALRFEEVLRSASFAEGSSGVRVNQGRRRLTAIIAFGLLTLFIAGLAYVFLIRAIREDQSSGQIRDEADLR